MRTSHKILHSFTQATRLIFAGAQVSEEYETAYKAFEKKCI